ncbi:MAG: histidinol-phosphate transaminase [Alphaproteobacteria bacterium]|nr:histidinol-phosphate transaminase [Alphaproteobacteria bacterium]
MVSLSAKPYLESIDIYQAGVQAGDELPDINLSANENPYGCAKQVQNHIINYLARTAPHTFSLYPEQGSLQLRMAIADKYGLPYQNILCGNGSDELIAQIAASFLNVGDHLLHSQYGFACYPLAAKKHGAVSIALEENNFTLTADTIINAITDSTKIIMLANPNNPTGFYMPHAKLRELHQRIPPHIVLMIDEAYAEYVDENRFASDETHATLELARNAKNIVVTRTFSKAHGLAGLRIGWCYGSDIIINAMLKIAEPFNVNLLAQQAAMISLNSDEFIKQSVADNAKMKQFLLQELPKHGLTPLPSQGNFLLCHAGSTQRAQDIFSQLKAQKILLRHTKKMNLPEYLRITIGSADQINILLNALKSIT